MQQVTLATLHPHVRDKGFVFVAERNGTQYALCVNGRNPISAVPVEGRVTVTHNHEGFGSYSLGIHATSVGKSNLKLDPICEAVLNKGWSVQGIEMELRLSSNRKPFPMTYSFPFGELKIKSTYTGKRERYCIASVKRSPCIEYNPDFCWAIIVDYRKPQVEYRATEFSFNVNVAMPQIYDKPGALEALLRAIDSLPHAKDMKGIHPAQLAPSVAA